MKTPSTDPRAARTRQLLRDAMIQLVAEKSFSSLSIQDVTRLAGLNRTTFYLHYSGLHELLEDSIRALFSQMRADIYAKKVTEMPQDAARLEPFVETVFRHLEKNEKIYRVMLGRQGDPLFRVLFQDLLSELIFEPIAHETSGEEPDHHLEMILKFFSAGFTGIAAWWLEKGKPISAGQAARQITRGILPDYLRLIGN